MKSSEKQLYYSSYIKYLQDTYDYSLQSAEPYFIDILNSQTTKNLLQNLNKQELETSTNISILYSIKRWSFKPKIEFQSSYNELTSDLLDSEIIRSKNSTSINKYMVKPTLLSNFDLGKLQISVQTSLVINSVDVKTLAYKNKKQAVFFEPSIDINWQISPFWQWFANANSNKEFGNTSLVYDNNVLNSNSFFNSPLDLSTLNNNNNINSIIRYSNPFKSINIEFYIEQRNTHKDFIYAQNILSNGQSSFKLRPLDNYRRVNNISSSMNKYFYNQKLNLNFKINKNISYSTSLINDLNIQNRFKVTKLACKVIYNQIDWMGIQTEIYFQHSKYENNSSTTNYNEIESTSNIFVTPKKNQLLDLSLNLYKLYYNNEVISYPFLDFMYRLTIANKKIDLELKWKNILNKKYYHRVYVDDAQISEVNYQLRQSQILFTMKFNIK